MNPEEAQKRLDDLLDDYHDKPHEYSAGCPFAWGKPCECGLQEAKQALSELFRDIMGEVIGRTPGNNDMLSQCENYSRDQQRKIRKDMRDRARRYFPVDGGGEK